MHEDTAAGYDAVAREYAARLFHELDRKPFDRAFLEAFVTSLPSGPVLDLGCGPGQVSHFIDGLGRRVVGVDLSRAMVAEAQRLSPALDFRQGDMCALDLASASVAGIVALYSIIHLGPENLSQAAREMHRVLAPGGRVAVSFHVGDEVRHVDELWGVKTDLDFNFLQPAAVEDALESAGLAVLQCVIRPPYAPDVEAQTQRCYIVAATRS